MPEPAICEFLLDPATGTGNFIVNLLRRIAAIAPQNLRRKYDEDLFANEIMLLPYYIAAMNIEHEYYTQTGEYRPFEGICFADTLELAERVAHQGLGERSLWMTERNSERVEHEKDARIMVVIGNPPYNVGQENENDNNKNRKYPVIDGRVRDTYVKDSEATLKTQLYDAYVRFFRWAVDRLQGRDGIVCLVTNNSFVDQFAFDGMRKHLMQDFTDVYHIDLHGNVRKNPKISGTTHNVFGIQVGVGITIAIRSSAHAEHTFYYCRVPEYWRREEKTALLAQRRNIYGVEWRQLEPDERHNWLTEGMRPEFAAFFPLATQEVKSIRYPGIFEMHSGGVKTNRDTWAYDFNSGMLASKMERFIQAYNGEVDRWRRLGNNNLSVDDFVTQDETRIKWSGDLKVQLARGKYAFYTEHNIRTSLYRPFVKRYLYFDGLLNNSRYLQPYFFPTPRSEGENAEICVPGPGDRKGFGCLASDAIPNLDLAFEKAQCFPLYTYDEDGSNRRENVTDWALARFRERYGNDVTRRDIFDYVYGLLHHPQYRERYAENLKRELPRIPLLPSRADYDVVRATGAALAKLHLDYETGPEYKLTWHTNKAVPMNWRVTKMKLSPDRQAVIYNEWLTLEGIPPEAFEYRLGNRSALEWVIDQYQVSTDNRSGITSDPNRDGSDEERQYIARLICKVTHVSVETVRLVRELAAKVDLLAAVGVGASVAVGAAEVAGG